MGKKSKKFQQFKKLSPHARGEIKSAKRKDEKNKRQKIKKIKNNDFSLRTQLQAPNISQQK